MFVLVLQLFSDIVINIAYMVHIQIMLHNTNYFYIVYVSVKVTCIT